MKIKIEIHAFEEISSVPAGGVFKPIDVGDFYVRVIGYSNTNGVSAVRLYDGQLKVFPSNFHAVYYPDAELVVK